MKPSIISATQYAQVNGHGEWDAWYECDNCGKDFAYNTGCHSHSSEADARLQSELQFDIQQRRFCSRCGNKLTDWEAKE